MTPVPATVLITGDEAGSRADSSTAAAVTPAIATIAPAISSMTRLGTRQRHPAANGSTGRAPPASRPPGVGGVLPPTLVSANQSAIWVREWNPSLFRICSTWLSAVRSEMKSLAAISRLVRPSARSADQVADRAAGAPVGRGGRRGRADHRRGPALLASH